MVVVCMKVRFKEIRNSKAWYDYELLEMYEVGMRLHVFDVKNIAANKFSLTGNYVKILNEEAFLLGESSEQSIKLLLKKPELRRLIGKVQEKGLTLVPLRIYPARGKFKLEIALAKGKKTFEKRAADKAREADLEANRVVKSQKLGDY
jgi:SsrA-binding protein